MNTKRILVAVSSGLLLAAATPGFSAQPAGAPMHGVRGNDWNGERAQRDAGPRHRDGPPAGVAERSHSPRPHDRIVSRQSEPVARPAMYRHVPPPVVSRPAVIERPVVVQRPVVIERPVIVERPVIQHRTVYVERPAYVERRVIYERPYRYYREPYYEEPPPAGEPNLFGMIGGALIGAVIGNEVGGEDAVAIGALLGGVLGSSF